MLTVTDFAKTLTARNGRKRGVTRQHVLYLLKNGRILGAVQIGATKKRKGMWVIPENAQVIDLPNRIKKTK